MGKLTSRSLSTGVTGNDLVHIVNTSDLSQSVNGSSYKATLNQLSSFFDGKYVTGSTFNSGTNILTLTRNDNVSLNTNLSSLASDVYVVSGTYNINTGVVTFTNSTGGTFSVSGFITGFTDTYVTGFTYSNNTFTITKNDGLSGLTQTVNTMTGLTVNGVLSANTISANTISGNGSGITNISISNVTNLQSSLDNKFNKSGGTVTGATFFSNGVSANTISATTYLNLPLDIYLTGGTYSAGTTTFKNNSGGTFNVTGFTTTDTYVTGFSYNNNVVTLKQNQNQSDKTITIDVMTGLTVNGIFSANTISGIGSGLTNISINSVTNLQSSLDDKFDKSGGVITGDVLLYGNINIQNGLTAGTIYSTNYLNLPLDIYVTGGTYSAGTITIKNNSGNTFDITGLTSNDTYVTGFTYDSNTLTIKQTQNQSDKIVVINKMTGLTINGDLTVSGGTQSWFSGNSSSDLVRITQTGTGNALVVEDSNNPDTTPFVINNIGRVGIGTTSPSNFIDVYSTSEAMIQLTTTGSTFSLFGLNGEEGYVYINNKKYLNFYTNNTRRISISSGGTVGIGVDVPTEKLEVNGNTLIYGRLSATTISATTYLNLPLDIRVTGGTYLNNTFTFTNNTGGTFSTFFNTVTGLTVNGNLTVTGNTTSNSISATTITGTTLYGSGSGLINIPIAGVTNLQSSLDNKFDKSGGTVTGNVLITGDVTILGTATTINTQTLTVKDNIITINSNYSGNTIPYPGTSGIEVLRGSATTATLLWDEISQKWIAGVSGNTKQILFSGDSLSLLNSGHTHPISEIINLQSSLDNKFDKSGGVVTGNTVFTNGVTATTISATTYLNLPLDIRVTGGTYSAGTVTITNNTGGTFNITGFSTSTQFTGGTVNGSTIFTNGVSANTISATTYLNLPLDIRVTGGTYSAGTVTIINNTGGTFNISGFSTSTATAFTGGTVTGSTNFTGGVTANTISATTYLNLPLDIRVTGASYNNNIFTYTNNTGGTFSTFFNTVTGLTVNGNLTVTGNTSVQSLTGTSAVFSGSGANILTVIGSGSTISPIFSVQGSTGSTIFSVSDSISGPLFWVDTILDVPIIEVYDTSPNLIIYGGVSATTLTATTISATTYQNLPVTADTFVTGFTYGSNTFTISQNQGKSALTTTINTVTGLTVNGNLTVTGNTKSNSISATTITGTTLYGNGSNITNILISNVTNLQTNLDNKFDKSGGTVTGNVLITGDVTVLGTATTINTQTLTVKDNIITINNNYTGNTIPYPGTSGIEVLRGSATTATLLWDEISQKWIAGVSGNTKQILFSGDSLSLLNSGHTHPISEIINLQSSLDNKYDKSGGTINGDVTINGVLYLSGASESKITGFDLPMYLETPELRIGSTGSTSTNLFGYGKTSDGNTIIDLISETTNLYGTRLIRGAGANGITEFIHKGTGDFIIGTLDLSSIYFYVNDTIGMIISNDGNIGINTASPSEKLHVIGNVIIDGNTSLQSLTATTISATTYLNLPVIADTFVTGFTYSNNTYSLSRNNGLSALTQTVNTMTGLTINGNLYVSGNTQSVFSGNSSIELVRITQTGNGDAFVVEDSANSDSSHFVINASGNTAIGLVQPTGNDKLSVSGNTTIYGVLSATTVYSNSIGVKTNSPTFDLEVNGTFGATSKSFVIKHPTQEGKKLVYGAIEGPEFGVYVRGKVDGDIIELPEEWVGLVDENSITVQLTGDGMLKLLYVKNIKDNKVYISNMIPFIKSTGYYTVYGERKDIDKIKKII